jgi:hypothetical protein
VKRCYIYAALALIVSICNFAAPPGQQLVPWSSCVDPAKDSVTYAREIHLTIPTGITGGFKSANVDRNGKILLISQTSGGKAAWTSIDLTTGKSAPSFSEVMRMDEEALASPDGTMLAGVGLDPPSGESFQVWSIPQKKRIVNMKSVAGNGAPDHALTFLDTSHLLVHCFNSKGNDALQIVDISNSKIDKTITLQEHLQLSKVFAVSPGGKFFAASTSFGTSGQGIFIVDIFAGKTVGQSLVPLAGHFHQLGSARGLCFSRDAKEIAGVFEMGSKRTLVIWNCADGKVTGNFPCEISPENWDDSLGRYMEYQPSGKRLRISHFLIDRTSGETVETIPSPPGDKGTIPLVMLLGDEVALTSSLPEINREKVRIVTVKTGR